MFAIRLASLLTLSSTLLSCASGPIEINDSPLLEAAEIPEPSRMRLWESFRREFQFQKSLSKESTLYVENMLARLYPSENLGRLRLFIFRDPSMSLDRAGSVFPGTGILLNASVFSRLTEEPELAALLAFIYERSMLPSFRDRFAEEINTVVHQTGKLTNFLTEEEMTAISGATDRLYHAGYDPRGVLGFLSILPETPEGKLKLLKEVSQQRMFKYPPLVNPTARTAEFYKFKRENGKL